MNIDNLTLGFLDAISAVICFVLVWFMSKPYRRIGERKYIGLPLAFSFLGASLLMGLTRIIESVLFVDVMRWFQLFTQSYAFAFLATTYYFSRRRKGSNGLGVSLSFAAILLVAMVSFIIFFVAPAYELPSFSNADDIMRIFNIVCLGYISIQAIRSYATKPDFKTIWFPIGYILLGFSQYSFLLWSLDTSFWAFVGAHLLRFAALLLFMLVTYQAFYTSSEGYSIIKEFE